MKIFKSFLISLCLCAFVAAPVFAGITHEFVSPKADGPDPTQIRPSNWNALHIIAPGSITDAMLQNTYAPTDGEYVTYSANPLLTSERVLTNGTNTTVDLGTAGQAKVNLSGTHADSFHTDSYSGVGACGANLWASTLNDNAAPTCTQPAFSNLSGRAALNQITDNDATSNLCLVSGGAGGEPNYVTCPGGGAPTTAGYWTKTADAGLSNEQDMSVLGTGLIINTTTTGVPVIYGGTSCTNQFPRSLDASGAATCASVADADISGTIAGTKTFSAGAFANATTYTLGKSTPTTVVLDVGHNGTSALVNTFHIADHAHSSTAGFGGQIATSALSGTITDAQLASNYSGVGACGANTWASTLSDNTAPTCTQPAFSNLSGRAALNQITDNDTTANLCLVSGGSGGEPNYATCPGGGAPTTAGYWTKTADAGLSNEQDMSVLGTGLIINTTTTGVPTIYGGSSCTNQFARSTNASGALTCAGVGVNDFTANQGTTTQVLHGNAAGQPSWGAIAAADLPAAGNSSLGAVKGTGSALVCSGTDKATGFAADGTLQCATDQTSGPFTIVYLSADHAISSTTGTEVTGLSSTLTTGTYRFSYWLLVQSATATVGQGLGINFTGTGSMNMIRRYTSTGASASTGVPDDVANALTGFLTDGYAASAFSTTAPNTMTTGIAVINVNTLQTIEGILFVTVGGDIELWHSSETATSTTVKAGSSLVLTKVN